MKRSDRGGMNDGEEKPEDAEEPSGITADQHCAGHPDGTCPAGGRDDCRCYSEIYPESAD